jgi:hypothetical protein
VSTGAYGFDPLIAVDIRNWIFREAKADMPIFEILQAETNSFMYHSVACLRLADAICSVRSPSVKALVPKSHVEHFYKSERLGSDMNLGKPTKFFSSCGSPHVSITPASQV